jgi:hypothetical protein
MSLGATAVGASEGRMSDLSPKCAPKPTSADYPG